MPTDNSLATVIGLGATNEGQFAASPVLNQVTVNYVDPERCKAMYPTQLKPSMLCAGESWRRQASHLPQLFCG